MTRYIDNGDGTITDNKTGLMWETGPGPRLAWEAAIDRCYDLQLAGYDDWRLPTRPELETILDLDCFNPACARIFGAASDCYWSSTTYCGTPFYAWSVSCGNGIVSVDDKSIGYRVRAVRGSMITGGDRC